MLEVAALQHDALGGGGANDKVVGSVGQGCGGGHGEGRLAAGEGDPVWSKVLSTHTSVCTANKERGRT